MGKSAFILLILEFVFGCAFFEEITTEQGENPNFDSRRETFLWGFFDDPKKAPELKAKATRNRYCCRTKHKNDAKDIKCHCDYCVCTNEFRCAHEMTEKERRFVINECLNSKTERSGTEGAEYITNFQTAVFGRSDDTVDAKSEEDAQSVQQYQVELALRLFDRYEELSNHGKVHWNPAKHCTTMWM